LLFCRTVSTEIHVRNVERSDDATLTDISYGPTSFSAG
jgi:hypothetical protein